MGNIFNTFSYKKEHINVKKIQQLEKVTSRVKMRNRKNHRNLIVIFILSARRDCFLCMKRSFTPRRRSRQCKAFECTKTSSRTKYKQYFFYN
jgi:hypothetical protein